MCPFRFIIIMASLVKFILPLYFILKCWNVNIYFLSFKFTFKILQIQDFYSVLVKINKSILLHTDKLSGKRRSRNIQKLRHFFPAVWKEQILGLLPSILQKEYVYNFLSGAVQ